MSSRGPVTRGANGWLPLTVAFCGAASPHSHHSLFYPLAPSWSICICLHAYQLSLLIQFRKMSSQIRLQRILADGLMRKWREWSRRRSSECAHSQRNCMTASGRGVAWLPVGAVLQDCNGVCTCALLHEWALGILTNTAGSEGPKMLGPFN